ncbi:MAG: acetyl-CoA carboxylase biotin carboxyl carrier protein subunit [Planctomycetia bacterium]
MKYFVEWAGRTREVEIRLVDGRTQVLVDGAPHVADVAGAGNDGLLSLLLDGGSWTIATRFEEGHAVLSFHDREVRVRIEDERTRAARLATGGARQASGRVDVKSVMPGVVKELRVKAGEAVSAGQPLLILEAMKMENEIRAPHEGLVEVLHVAPGTAVEKGARLVTVGPRA